jgi:hypothetical protein
MGKGGRRLLFFAMYSELLIISQLLAINKIIDWRIT